MRPTRLQVPTASRSLCALCRTPITTDNDSREHIIPNAIGGRRRVTGFLCEHCNNTLGHTWDSALCEQLEPLCVLLDVRRQRGSIKPIQVETTSGETLVLHADGRMGIPHGSVVLKEEDGIKSLHISARSKKELKGMLPGIVRKYPFLDSGTVLKEVTDTRKYTDDALHFSIQFGGHSAGRSIVKSALALAFFAGIDVASCEHAHDYFLSDKAPCFGYFNDVDLVLNRSEGMFFHCVFIHGDPRNGRVVGYVEYFGYQRILVCLSNKYTGPEVTECYAIDPISGKELDLQIDVHNIPVDLDAVYEYKRVSRGPMLSALNGLMEHVVQQGERRALEDAVADAWKHAAEHCGVKEGDKLSEGQAKEYAKVFAERIAPALVHLLTNRQFSANTWQHIRQTIGDTEGGPVS